MTDPSLQRVLEKAAQLQAVVPGAVAVSSQIARQLADPQPRDAQVTHQLASYKALEPRSHDWATVRAVLADLAERMTR